MPNMAPFLNKAPATQMFTIDSEEPQLEFSFFVSKAMDEKDSLSTMEITS